MPILTGIHLLEIHRNPCASIISILADVLYLVFQGRYIRSYNDSTLPQKAVLLNRNLFKIDDYIFEKTAIEH